MKKTGITIWIKRVFSIALLIVTINAFSVSVKANEVQSAETEASIRFTGSAVIPHPEPSPPEGPVILPEPGGNLPQTNEKQSISMPLMGWFLLLIVGYLHSKRQQKKSNELRTSIVDMNSNV